MAASNKLGGDDCTACRAANAAGVSGTAAAERLCDTGGASPGRRPPNNATSMMSAGAAIAAIGSAARRHGLERMRDSAGACALCIWDAVRMSDQCNAASSAARSTLSGLACRSCSNTAGAA
ncbi:hypothetical protein, partial [Xanthomonas maliensis]|uniref:hypothetical protein n=1 Tax=Xanthomonas maliensis TaxID=1321368 RepID=UPI001EE24419